MSERRAAGLVALAFAAGCAPSTRFSELPIVWQQPDAPIPVPRPRETLVNWSGIRDAAFRPLDRGLALDFWQEALDVNALDEVPESSWYLDPRRDPAAPERGPRALSAEEVARGASSEDTAPRPPLRIVEGKASGATPGFTVRDARGRRYLIKLDPRDWRGLATSTEVVATRLVWASGWRVPAELLIHLHPADLVLDPAATRTDEWGRRRPFTASHLRELLAQVPRGPDGRIQMLASLWLPGIPLGSFDWIGVRPDDPNDRIPHQDRRDLRGFGVIAAWINDIDTLENNSLDTYVGAPGRGHVLHFQQDVGGAFGNFARSPIDQWMGAETYLSPARIGVSLFTLGLWPRRWEGEPVRRRRALLLTQYPELGFFDEERFDPRRWHPLLPNPAFVRQTARDRYWGAKRVIAFDARELHAAIETGHYRPAAAERLFQILWSRRQAVARSFLSDVAALDYFRFEGGDLCFQDLWITAGLGGQEATRYRVGAEELEHAALAPSLGAEPRQRCVALPPEVGYRVLPLRVRRPGERRFGPAVRVHFVERSSGARRLVGVERDAR